MRRLWPRFSIAVLLAGGVVVGSRARSLADTFVHDTAGRLVAASRRGVTETFQYDGTGVLVRRCTRQSGSASCTRVLFDERSGPYGHVAAEQNATGTIRHVHGPLGAALVQDGSALAQVLSDELGSVRGLADTTGRLTMRRAYEPFGGARATAGTPLGSLGFVGEVTSGSGLVWLRARHYAPEMGRFLERDAVMGDPGELASLNRYTYAHANPLTNVDPSGHWIETAWDVASFSMSVHELSSGWGEAGLGMRTLLVGGVLVDGLGILLPLVPSGCGAAMKAHWAAKAAARASKARNKAVKPYAAVDGAMARVARENKLLIASRFRDARAADLDPFLATKSADFNQVKGWNPDRKTVPYRLGTYTSQFKLMDLEALKRVGPAVVTPDVDLAGIAKVLPDGNYAPQLLGTSSVDALDNPIIQGINRYHDDLAEIGAQTVVWHGDQTSGFLQKLPKLMENFDEYWTAPVHVWSPRGYAGVMQYDEFLKLTDPNAYDAILKSRPAL